MVYVMSRSSLTLGHVPAQHVDIGASVASRRYTLSHSANVSDITAPVLISHRECDPPFHVKRTTDRVYCYLFVTMFGTKEVTTITITPMLFWLKLLCA